MKKLDKDYLINLRCGNLMVQWLLERYRLHTPFVDLDFSGLENLDENEFRFLLELVKVYDQPRLFTPRAFDQTDIELILDYLKKNSHLLSGKKVR